jgi:hypothetical protein
MSKDMRATLYSKINADKTFGAKVTKLLAARDMQGIKDAYAERVQALAQEAMQKTLDTWYPNGLSLRETKAAKPAASKGTYRNIAEGQALVVKTKPQNLDRTVKHSDLMEIRGCGYAVVNGKHQLVSWRKN